MILTFYHFYLKCDVTTSVVEPHHGDADPDSTYHPEADPDADPYSQLLVDADPDPTFTQMRIRIRIQKKLKPLKQC